MKRILTLLLTMMMLAILSTSYAVAEETPDITVRLTEIKLISQTQSRICIKTERLFLYALLVRLWALMYLGTAENRK